MKKVFIAVILALFLSTTVFAAPPEDYNPRIITFPDCDTIDDLEAFVENDFVIPPGSSCKEPIPIELPMLKKKPMTPARLNALRLGSDYWFVPRSLKNLREQTRFFSYNEHFRGQELLYRYGASEEYVLGLLEQFEEAKEFYDVNASMRFVPESDVGIASADTQDGGGTITVAFYSSADGTSLDLEQLREIILYHEFGHIYVHKNFGDYIDSPLSFSDIFLFRPFDEYTANLYAYKVLPEDKKEIFAEGIRGQMNGLTYIGVKNGFDRADYPTLLQLHNQARKFDVLQLEAYFDLALSYETPELRQKFLALSNEFYNKAENLSKENYEETAVSIVDGVKELRELF